MVELLKLYGITFSVFMLIDLVWLGVIAKNLYRKYLGFLMSPTVNWTAAIGFYMLFIIGMIFFVIQPALDRGSLNYALLAGGFFGLITYGTYDLTNLATLKDWPLNITFIDLAWGTTLCALTSAISFILYRLVAK
jgi:uncharacterized membrane protein